MSAVVATAAIARAGDAAVGAAPDIEDAKPRADIVLLGVGTVGRAVLTRLSALADVADLRLRALANTRTRLQSADAIDPVAAIERLRDGEAADLQRSIAVLGAQDAVPRVVVDATASADVAACHALWLRQGLHVVTANKLAIGGVAANERAVRAAARAGATVYGDSATVGAGLPLLRSVRALRAGGDRILSLAGVVSGSLGWLFATFDGTRPFSACLREAHARGFTEPDARADLSGEDMRRKLLILVRAAGFALEPDDVTVESLVPEALRDRAAAPTDADWERCDEPLQRRLDSARRHGRVLRPVIRFDDHGRARAGLETLDRDDPLAQSRGCDNRVAIRSTRYATRPLLIEGPGAGAEVTAAALLDDVLSIAASAPKHRSA
ncbi:homoserine dehydrogenase [Chiayiivirga flava]|uniref:Homoserine dehydrogenase n=1 Tax=Chiayiivirga flava TaxID=659595 RepID=A0A7W8D5G1_9GAMM|nr:homoserine dehydrogenase [Chiayiivirga flava]MBB5207135.1 homoserine dehydrogenase [Chiayiivirga flava]